MEIGCAPNFDEYPQCESLYNEESAEWLTGVLPGGCTEVS